MFRCYVQIMEQQILDKPVDEIALNAALRKSGRKPLGLQIAGWCLVVGCALSIGAVVVSNPDLNGKLTGLLPASETVETSALPADPVVDGSTRNPEFVPEGAALATPVRALMAFGAVSQSARSALGFGSPADHVELPPMGDSDLAPLLDQALSDDAFANSKSLDSAFFGSASSAERPSVSIMPQSRIPVRRAGIASGN